MSDAAVPELTAKGAETRESVLDAAIECFGRDGFRRTSVAAIARAADVGGTVPYAYFENKEALFLSALDVDAASTIHECLPLIFDLPAATDWRRELLIALVAAVDRHPLARRVLAGLEPETTSRVFELQALVDLRAAVTERLRAGQSSGDVRADIDVEPVASGLVTVTLSLLMSILQLGPEMIEAARVEDVGAVISAALDQPR